MQKVAAQIVTMIPPELTVRAEQSLEACKDSRKLLYTLVFMKFTEICLFSFFNYRGSTQIVM
jgi:hypothetical protein